jgi:ATP-dependent DNA helicase RecQ
MERHQVTRGTILEHLTKSILAGNLLHGQKDLENLASVSSEQRQAAFAAFNELGPDLLKPIFDKLNGAVNYEEIKILRLLFLIGQKARQTSGPDWDTLT